MKSYQRHLIPIISIGISPLVQSTTASVTKYSPSIHPKDFFIIAIEYFFIFVLGISVYFLVKDKNAPIYIFIFDLFLSFVICTILYWRFDIYFIYYYSLPNNNFALFLILYLIKITECIINNTEIYKK